jgi:hypothetical protein
VNIFIDFNAHPDLGGEQVVFEHDPSPNRQHKQRQLYEVLNHVITAIKVEDNVVHLTLEPLPDIGMDPLKMPRETPSDEAADNCHRATRERLTQASTIQQQGVPNQTALVWRIDIDRLLAHDTWKTSQADGLITAKGNLQQNLMNCLDALKEKGNTIRELEAEIALLRSKK